MHISLHYGNMKDEPKIAMCSLPANFLQFYKGSAEVHFTYMEQWWQYQYSAAADQGTRREDILVMIRWPYTTVRHGCGQGHADMVKVQKAAPWSKHYSVQVGSTGQEATLYAMGHLWNNIQSFEGFLASEGDKMKILLWTKSDSKLGWTMKMVLEWQSNHAITT